MAITCKSISYSRIRGLFHARLVKAGLEKDIFGLVSLRSGGATNRFSYTLLKLHCRRTFADAEDGYYS